MYINVKKIYRYFTLLVIGLSLVFYGVINFVIDDHSMDQISDAEVIQRARELGMVGINEVLIEKLEDNE